MARLRALFGWHDATPLARAAWPSRRGRVGVAVLATLLVGLELRAIAGPHEDWPFSSAPMFAYYHAAEWPLFELVIYAEVAPGVERPLEPRADLGIGEIAFKRLLFADYYGSIDPAHPAGHHAGDTPELFRQRMSEFCRKVARAFARRSGTMPRSIRVELVRLTPHADRPGELEVKRVVERRTIMIFDAASDQARSP